MKYYNKEENCFENAQRYDESGKALYAEYTEEEYRALFDCDELHYVAYDESAGKPKQKVYDVETLRSIRRKKCFPYINRGAFWYETLTDEQKAELREWYRSWLDVTVELKVKQKPTWLK